MLTFHNHLFCFMSNKYQFASTATRQQFKSYGRCQEQITSKIVMERKYVLNRLYDNMTVWNLPINWERIETGFYHSVHISIQLINSHKRKHNEAFTLFDIFCTKLPHVSYFTSPAFLCEYMFYSHDLLVFILLKQYKRQQHAPRREYYGKYSYQANSAI